MHNFAKDISRYQAEGDQILANIRSDWLAKTAKDPHVVLRTKQLATDCHCFGCRCTSIGVSQLIAWHDGSDFCVKPLWAGMFGDPSVTSLLSTSDAISYRSAQVSIPFTTSDRCKMVGMSLLKQHICEQLAELKSTSNPRVDGYEIAPKDVVHKIDVEGCLTAIVYQKNEAIEWALLDGQEVRSHSVDLKYGSPAWALRDALTFASTGQIVFTNADGVRFLRPTEDFVTNLSLA